MARLNDGRYVVTAAGLDEKFIETVNVAVSAAVSVAEHKLAGAGTVYVRDTFDDSVVARVERHEDGCTFIHTELQAKRAVA